MTRQKAIKVVTFNCVKHVYVYHEGCGILPREPYNEHPDIETATKFLTDKGIQKPMVIEYKKKR